MICKSDVIVGLIQIIVVCQTKVFYSLVVFVAKHNHRCTAIVAEYWVGSIPAMQLRKAHVGIGIVGRLKISDACREQRHFRLRILLAVHNLCILRRKISDTEQKHKRQYTEYFL